MIIYHKNSVCAPYGKCTAHGSNSASGASQQKQRGKAPAAASSHPQKRRFTPAVQTQTGLPVGETLPVIRIEKIPDHKDRGQSFDNRLTHSRIEQKIRVESPIIPASFKTPLHSKESFHTGNPPLCGRLKQHLRQIGGRSLPGNAAENGTAKKDSCIKRPSPPRKAPSSPDSAPEARTDRSNPPPAQKTANNQDRTD